MYKYNTQCTECGFIFSFTEDDIIGGGELEIIYPNYYRILNNYIVCPECGCSNSSAPHPTWAAEGCHTRSSYRDRS